jgi:hypothetical protein
MTDLQDHGSNQIFLRFDHLRPFGLKRHHMLQTVVGYSPIILSNPQYFPPPSYDQPPTPLTVQVLSARREA